MPKIFYNFNKSKSITTDIQTDKLSNVSVDTFHEFAVGFYHVVQLAKNLHRLDGESKKTTNKKQKKNLEKKRIRCYESSWDKWWHPLFKQVLDFVCVQF